jgi:type IV pilus assembly protein PilM
MRRAPRTLTGLDIEPGYAAAVEARPGSAEVQRAALVELPADAVRDGEILDPDAVATGLRQMFAEHKLSPKVRLGVANQQIVVRIVDLPPIADAKQLESAVRFQAQEHIAMPLDQAVLEYVSLGLVGTADGPKSRVALVAARRDMVERVVTVARMAGLQPKAIDLSAFAMIRSLRQAADGESTVAYINVGGLTNLALAAGSTCLFTRVISAGSAQMVTELAERRGLTREHADGWLRHVGLTAPVETIDGDAEIVAASRLVLTEGVARIADEVRTNLDFFSAQGSTAAERAVLTGPASAMPGFADRLGEELRMPVEVRQVAEATPGAAGGVERAHLAIAAGLTLQEAAA